MAINVRTVALTTAALAAGLTLGSGMLGDTFEPRAAIAQGVGGAAAIQADIRDELRQLNSKVGQLTSKLERPMDVNVKSMPKSAD